MSTILPPQLLLRLLVQVVTLPPVWCMWDLYRLLVATDVDHMGMSVSEASQPLALYPPV